MESYSKASKDEMVWILNGLTASARLQLMKQKYRKAVKQNQQALLGI
jgi:hypothetical protein